MTNHQIHTVNITFEVYTNKCEQDLKRHIERIQDELAGMLDQDLKDSTEMVSARIVESTFHVHDFSGGE
tara:strand:+ start:8609 stop:8815 length:207 start_codon:yes stop_codon:yes gene_type:complete